MPIHRLSKGDLAARNRKIQSMVEYGCDYETIGRRYGLTAKTVNSMIAKGKIEKGAKDCFGSANAWERNCVDGIH